MLLAEELALVSIDPVTGRVRGDGRAAMNATLAGLLLAELHLIGRATVDAGRFPHGPTVTPTSDAPLPSALAAADRVVRQRGPKLRRILSSMDRGIKAQLGTGTWDTVLAGLESSGTISTDGGRQSRITVSDPATHALIVERLRATAVEGASVNPRDAALFRALGPSNLIELVAADRRSRTRRPLQRRASTLCDGTPLGTIGHTVDRILYDARNTSTTE